jgi:hypothetical protein
MVQKRAGAQNPRLSMLLLHYGATIGRSLAEAQADELLDESDEAGVIVRVNARSGLLRARPVSDGFATAHEELRCRQLGRVSRPASFTGGHHA